MNGPLRIGVDVGGTFTDIINLQPDGRVVARKVLSTPPDFSSGIRKGVAGILQQDGFQGDQVQEFIHAATVATNAIVTRTGAIVGLLTTQGFRDVLEIRRMRMHKLYDIRYEKPVPLVPRHLRMEVPGRLDPAGNELVPLDETAVKEAVRRLVEAGVESIAVCYLHAYANSTHEARTREAIRREAPKVFISLSSEVLPEIKEYERTSTTVINAYVQPVVAEYFDAMETDLRGLGIARPIMVMQSNGGMMSVETAKLKPVHVIESGPAAGVTGVHHLASRMGLRDVISLDMGGTTAKAALIEDAEISRSPEYEVGGEISIGHRLMKGSGYLLRVPSVDLAEVGAGGGSIAWTDEAGALKVGPGSAGALPGPACYDLGGQQPTITDADLLIGFIPESLGGGTLRVHPHLAEKAIREKIADPLGMDLTAAAWGIRTVANSNLIRALRAVSTERGRDPAMFVLFSFGGMGPVHALDLAAELGIRRVVIPPLPGVFSALGLLFAQVEHHLIQTYYASTRGLDLEKVNKLIDELVDESFATLNREGYDSGHRSINLFADTRYVGQDHALTISLRGGRMTTKVVSALVEDFNGEHEKTYGYRSENEEVQIVALRCVARGLTDGARVPDRLQIAHASQKSKLASRQCYFGPDLGWITTDVLRRADLTLARSLAGPAIIEEDTSLTVVPPGWSAGLDEWSNIVLEPS